MRRAGCNFIKNKWRDDHPAIPPLKLRFDQERPLRRSGCILGFVALWCWRRLAAFRLGLAALHRRTAETPISTRRAVWPAVAIGTAEATRATLPRLATTAAHHLAHPFGGLDVFILGDAAVAIRVHAFEALLGVTKHAHAAAAFATGAHAWTLTITALPIGTWAALSFAALTVGTWTALPFAWWTAEATFPTALRAAVTTGAAHALPFRTAAQILRQRGDFRLIDKAIAIRVHLGEAVFGLALAHVGELFLADFAVVVGVGALDELGQTCAWITARGTTLRPATRRRIRLGGRWRGLVGGRVFRCVLCDGKTGQAKKAKTLEERFFKFHGSCVCLVVEARSLKQTHRSLVARVMENSCQLRQQRLV